MTRRAAVTAVAVVAVLAGLMSSQPVSRAQEPVEETPRLPGVTVSAIDGIVDDNGLTFTVTVAGAQSRGPIGPVDVQLRLDVHARTRSRFGLGSALDDGELGERIGVLETDPARLPSDGELVTTLRGSAEDLGLEGAAAGVYPTVLTVTDGTRTHSTTTAVVVPPADGQPIRLAVLLDLQAPMAVQNETVDSAAVRAAVSRVEDAVRALATDLPVTLGLDARMIDEVRAVADAQVSTGEASDADAAAVALDGLTDATRSRSTEVVVYPYGPADIVAMVRAGLAARAQDLLARAQAVAADLEDGQTSGDSILLVPRGLDPATAGWVGGVADATVLTEADLGLPLRRDLPATPPAVRRLAGIPELVVAVPDPFIAGALDDDEPTSDPVLTAQRVLAESAAIFFERPGDREPRGLLMTPSLDHAALVPILASQAEGATWLRPVTLTGLLADVAPSGDPETLRYTADQQAAELPTPYLKAIARAEAELPGVRALLGDDEADALQRALGNLYALAYRAAALRFDVRELPDEPAQRIAEVRDAITVIVGPPLTLTGTEGTVPVTFGNTSDREVQVRVGALTTRYAVEDGDGRELTLPADGERTVTFDVRALAPGSRYPIIIEVTDVEGRVTLAMGQVAVQSTAFNVAGLVVTAAGALVLVAWGLNTVVRRRKRDTPDSSEAPEDNADLSADGTEQPAGQGGPR